MLPSIQGERSQSGLLRVARKNLCDVEDMYLKRQGEVQEMLLNHSGVRTSHNIQHESCANAPVKRSSASSLRIVDDRQSTLVFCGVGST